jgi:hypothetical protein
MCTVDKGGSEASLRGKGLFEKVEPVRACDCRIASAFSGTVVEVEIDDSGGRGRRCGVGEDKTAIFVSLSLVTEDEDEDEDDGRVVSPNAVPGKREFKRLEPEGVWSEELGLELLRLPPLAVEVDNKPA